MAEDGRGADQDPERLIARALESVLDAVPELPGGDLLLPETSVKAQPWAETAAPPGRNKRPLESVIEEYEARVAAAPNARAGKPSETHPAAAYLERFTPVAASEGRRAGRRRWQGTRRRRGGRRGRGGQPAR
jgi:hypothetical protein